MTYVYTHVMYTGVMCTCFMYTNVMYTVVVKEVKVSSYIAQDPIIRIAQSAFLTLLPGRLFQSKIISASLGSIQPRGYFAKTVRTQIVITAYSQLLIHTAE